MKVSIITVTLNSEKTIKDAINSVLKQTYENIEYIVVDGKSKDSTVEIVNSYGSKVNKFLSEPDKGIYDAMNKGIRLATGDVVGILNSDDFYIDENVIEKVVKAFEEKEVDSLFANLVFVRPNNLEKTVRLYNSSQFNPSKFAYGWMPAHPTFFVKRAFYEKYGLFNTGYKIAADFELLVRFLFKHRISYYYLDDILIKMRTGGVSTRNFRSNWILNKEIIRACFENGIKTNLFKVSLKYFKKVFELIGHK